MIHDQCFGARRLTARRPGGMLGAGSAVRRRALGFRPHRRNAAGAVAIAAATIAIGCEEGIRVEQVLREEHGPNATLILDLAIGEEVAAGAEYQFASIRNVLVTPEGRMWLLDGSSPLRGGTPLIRRFDSRGQFLGTVGGAGAGPGEYVDPVGLTLMPDGRVAPRDTGLRDRITLYAADGSLDTTWSTNASLRLGRIPPIAVDTGGVMWLSTLEYRSSGPTTTYVRLENGSVIDSVRLPEVPEIDVDRLTVTRTLSSGRKEDVQIPVPYGPRGAVTWLPSGSFAIARTDEYRIELLQPPATRRTRSRFISRGIAPIPVPEAERDALRRYLVAQREEVGDRSRAAIPEIPRFKPLIRYLQSSADGQLLVFVSMPPRLLHDEWTEPQAFDVFAADGRFNGRVVLPDSLTLAYMRGSLIWGVFRGAHDVESIRRYRMEWD